MSEPLPASRPEREALVRRLRSRGLLLREVAAEIGVAISTVDSWLNDPGGERLRIRKDGYRGRCEACGQPTDGSGGRASAPRLCLACFRAQPHSLERAQRLGTGAVKRYSERQLLDALMRADRLGLGTATLYDRWAAANQLPSLKTLVDRFGSWNQARKAAGVPTRRSSRAVHHRATAERCVRAIAAAWLEFGEPPTVRRYDLARRPSDPCAATVRARCGSWTQTLAVASELIANTEGHRAALPAAA